MVIIVLKCFFFVFFLFAVQDEEEFPDLATGGAVQRNKPEQVQLKLPKPLVSVEVNILCVCLNTPD